MRIVLKDTVRKQEGSDFGWNMAQVPTGTGSPLKIADVRTVDLFVYDKNETARDADGNRIPLYETGLTPSAVISDTLRRNGDGASPAIPWTENNIGCNFAHYLYQGTVFADPLVERGGHVYRQEYRIITAAFGVVWVIFESASYGVMSGGGGSGGPPPPNPDFNFAVVGANSQTVQQGVTTSFDFGISPINGFTADVTFVVTAVTPSIAHATFQFAPNPITGGTGTTTMTVFTDAALTLPNTYQILVTATSGALSHVASVTLGITSSGGGSTGWTNFTASADTIVHYVSSATGSDSNDGLTPATAFRTILAGYNSLRFGYPDWLLFSCGDTWSELNFGSAFPQFYKYGRSTTEPLLISSYVPSSGAHAGSVVRPKFNCADKDGMFMTNNGTQTHTAAATWTQATLTLTFPGNPFLHYPSAFNWAGRTVTGVSGAGVVSGSYTVVSGNNATSALVLSTTICSGAPGNRTNVTGDFLIYANDIAIVGLHFYSDGNVDGAAAGVAAIDWLGQSQDILIEDCKMEGFSQNVVIERTPDPTNRVTPDSTWMTNVIFRRNVVIDAHASVNVSLFVGNGVYTAWCNGIVVEENILEHNGWRQDMRGSYQAYNKHNAYFQNSSHNVTVRGNVITETDIQMRGGGLCENNLFLNNYIGLQFGIGTTSQDDPAGVVGSITGNVMLGGSNIGDGLRLIHAATWNEATLTLTVTDPVNPWAGQVANSMVGFTIGGTSGPPGWLDDSVSINFHCTGGTGATVTDPAHVFGGHRITASTTNTLTFDRSIGAGANGHNDITGWTTYGTAQGSRGLFLYTGNIASATISNNILANQFRIVAGRAVSDGPQPPGQNATLIEMTDGLKGGGTSPIGCNNMTFSLNKIYNWGADNVGMPTNYTGGRMLHLERDNPGNSKYSGIKFDRNEYTNNISQDPIVNYAFSNGATGLDGSLGNNHLWTAIADPNAWFQLPANSNLATWKAGQSPPDTSSTAQAATYTNPTADITSFLAQVSPSLPGVTISYQGYIDAIRNLSKASGDTYWKALMPTFGAGHTEFGPLAYFRAAFS